MAQRARGGQKLSAWLVSGWFLFMWIIDALDVRSGGYLRALGFSLIVLGMTLDALLTTWCSKEISPKHSKLVATPVWLGLVLFTITILMPITPGFRDVSIPFVPDVELSVISAERRGSSGEMTPKPGYIFLNLVVKVESRWWARKVELDYYDFRFAGKGYAVSPDYPSSYHFADYCTDDVAVPTNGAASCRLLFEIPETIEGGRLRFYDINYYDSVKVKF